MSEAAPEQPVGGRELGERERRILDTHDRLASLPPGPRERAIREELGMKPILYYLVLNALLDSAEAQAYQPVIVNRLRRVRDENRRRYQ